ncbi:hypothetical protein D7V80_26725 [Corallococcus sp. CA054B]|nr:hypothetical protein D7V80_26725 [Corallococcus sp. CA054B]
MGCFVCCFAAAFAAASAAAFAAASAAAFAAARAAASAAARAAASAAARAAAAAEPSMGVVMSGTPTFSRIEKVPGILYISSRMLPDSRQSRESRSDAGDTPVSLDGLHGSRGFLMTQDGIADAMDFPGDAPLLSGRVMPSRAIQARSSERSIHWPRPTHPAEVNRVSVHATLKGASRDMSTGNGAHPATKDAGVSHSALRPRVSAWMRPRASPVRAKPTNSARP